MKGKQKGTVQGKKSSPSRGKVKASGKTLKERYPYSPPPQNIKYLTDNTYEMTVMARIMRARVKYHKTFRVSEYKGWKEARAAGKQWIQEKLEILPEHQMWKPGQLTKKNRSGIVGMMLAPRTVVSGGKEYTYWSWSASWHTRPKRSTVGWQIGKFTEEEAFVLAYLTLEMKTLSREKVLAEFKKVRKTARYEKILTERSLTVKKEEKRRGMSPAKVKKTKKKLTSKTSVKKAATGKKKRLKHTGKNLSAEKKREKLPPPSVRDELEVHLL